MKKLGRIGRIGHRIHGDLRVRTRGVRWEYVHRAIDDCIRLGYADVLADERGPTTAAFLTRADSWFAWRKVGVLALLTDSGKNYTGRDVAAVCDAR